MSRKGVDICDAMVLNNDMSTTTYRMTANGTSIAITSEGTKITAAELAAGMQKWNVGMGWWDEVVSVSKVDRWGKVTVEFPTYSCKIKADTVVTVK